MQCNVYVVTTCQPCAVSSPLRCDSFTAPELPHGDPPVSRFPVDVLAGGFDSITDEMMEGYKEPGRPRCNRPVWIVLFGGYPVASSYCHDFSGICQTSVPRYKNTRGNSVWPHRGGAGCRSLSFAKHLVKATLWYVNVDNSILNRISWAIFHSYVKLPQGTVT